MIYSVQLGVPESTYFKVLPDLFAKMFTQLEKIDMVFCYGEAGRNSVQACQLYAEKYPDRVHPARRTIDNIIRSFRGTGSVQPAKRNRVETQTHEGAEVAVLAAVRVDPHASSRQIARDSGISRSRFCEY